MGNWGSWIVIGLLLIAGGGLALANPFAASLAVELLVGWIFLIAGVVQLYAAFRGARNSRIYWVLLLSGALSVLIGIAVLANFQQAATALLGIVLAVELISNGIGAVAYGLALRDRS